MPGASKLLFEEYWFATLILCSWSAPSAGVITSHLISLSLPCPCSLHCSCLKRHQTWNGSMGGAIRKLLESNMIQNTQAFPVKAAQPGYYLLWLVRMQHGKETQARSPHPVTELWPCSDKWETGQDSSHAWSTAIDWHDLEWWGKRVLLYAKFKCIALLWVMG